MKTIELGNQKRRLDLQPENEMNWANVNEVKYAALKWLELSEWTESTWGVNERSERVGVIVEVVEVGGRGKGDMAKCVGREARETVGNECVVDAFVRDDVMSWNDADAKIQCLKWNNGRSSFFRPIRSFRASRWCWSSLEAVMSVEAGSVELIVVSVRVIFGLWGRFRS